MMKTYWVLSKKPKNGDNQLLNPLQKKKLSLPQKKCSISPSEIDEIFERPSNRPSTGSPPLPCSRETSVSYRTGSKSTHGTPRNSISPKPEEWPAMERLLNGMREEEDLSLVRDLPSFPRTTSNVRYSTASLIPNLLLPKDSIDVHSTSEGVTSSTLHSIDCSKEPLALDDSPPPATENISTLKDFERLAEVTAQNSRKLANWSHYITSIVQQRQVVGLGNTTHDLKQGSDHQATITAGQFGPNYLGSSVDPEDSDTPSNKGRKETCLIHKSTSRGSTFDHDQSQNNVHQPTCNII